MNSAAIDKLTETSLPTRKSVRQLRWFETSFRAQMAAVSAQTGQHYDLSDQRLIDTFLSWHHAFDSQKPASRMVRRAYVSFAAGMMFYELLHKRPVSVRTGSAPAEAKTPALMHPEAYLYASYCHVIRQAILGEDFWLDTNAPDRMDEIAIWQTFSKETTQDRAAAIAFLDLFINGSRTWAIPKMTHSQGGFGNRLWDLAARQSDADVPTRVDIPKGAALRNISDNARLGQMQLPSATKLVLIAFEGVAAQTDLIDSEELSTLLNDYGVPLTPQETRDRFSGQPLSSALTYIAERTGKLCPKDFLEKLDQRLVDRDTVDLVLTPGFELFLGRLKAANLDVAIVSHGRNRRVDAAQNLPALSALKSAGPIHYLDPANRVGNGLRSTIRARGHAPETAILIDASSTGVGMAKNLSMPVFGFVDKTRIADRNMLICAGAQAVLVDFEELTLGR